MSRLKLAAPPPGAGVHHLDSAGSASIRLVTRPTSPEAGSTRTASSNGSVVVPYRARIVAARSCSPAVRWMPINALVALAAEGAPVVPTADSAGVVEGAISDVVSPMRHSPQE